MFTGSLQGFHVSHWKNTARLMASGPAVVESDSFKKSVIFSLQLPTLKSLSVDNIVFSPDLDSLPVGWLAVILSNADFCPTLLHVHIFPLLLKM